MKRIRAAWAAFLNPPKPGPIPYTLVAVDYDAAKIMDAIRRHQQRKGRPPTV